MTEAGALTVFEYLGANVCIRSGNVELTYPDNERPHHGLEPDWWTKGHCRTSVLSAWCWWRPFSALAHQSMQTRRACPRRRCGGRTTVVQDLAVRYGLDVNPANPTIGLARVPQVLQLVQRARASAVRTGGNWATEEPSPGHYDFSEVDESSLAKADRLTVLFELGKEPKWDALGGNVNAPPSDCDTPSASCASVRHT